MVPGAAVRHGLGSTAVTWKVWMPAASSNQCISQACAAQEVGGRCIEMVAAAPASKAACAARARAETAKLLAEIQARDTKDVAQDT